jgi:hypothetical protein
MGVGGYHHFFLKCKLLDLQHNAHRHIVMMNHSGLFPVDNMAQLCSTAG